MEHQPAERPEQEYYNKRLLRERRLKLAGHLYTLDPDTSPSLPAIVVGPPGSSVKEQAAEKLLIPVEVRRHEIAEFDRTGRKVSIVDPSYS